jgi:uncharacterized phage protein (TIGR02218 family)
MLSVSSAFWLRMQSDPDLTEIIDVYLPGGTTFHWTTCNQQITYTLSAAATKYDPFPGMVPQGIEESIDLGVNVVNFTMANTSQSMSDLLASSDFQEADVHIGRVFTGTPDLGRMEMYRGQMGDFTHNRLSVSGQVRNQWRSLGVRWPLHSYQNNCVWRFGSDGCGFNVTSITVASLGTVAGSCTTLNLLLVTGALSAYNNGRFDFGKLTVITGANSGQQRTIRSHSGSLLKLSHPLPVNSFANTAVSIYPGCRKRLIDDCKSLYNNDANFMGFPWIPAQENAW